MNFDRKPAILKDGWTIFVILVLVRFCRFSALQAEPGNESMKDTLIVIPLKTQLNKIPGRQWTLLPPQFDTQNTVCCINIHFTVGSRFHWIHITHFYTVLFFLDGPCNKCLAKEPSSPPHPKLSVQLPPWRIIASFSNQKFPLLMKLKILPKTP